MGDLLFTCPRCSKHLAIDQAGIGRSLACPDCGQTIKAPLPDLLFYCSACKTTLCAPGGLKGTSFDCSNCGRELTVPEVTSILCTLCSANIEMDGETFESVAGEEINCPACDAVIDLPVMPF